MEKIQLAVAARQAAGKSANKKLRRQGWVPAVVYGHSRETLPLQVGLQELTKALGGITGRNVVITLKVENQGKSSNKTTLIKEIQRNPLSGEVLHIDFYEVSLTKEIKVEIPVVAKGEAVGVKMDGGVLDHSLWLLEVSCLPTQIPERIEVDVSNLKIGDSIHVKDLAVLPGVKILSNPETSVFSVKLPTKEAEIPAAGAVEEAEAAEPEVIREKKEEPEEAAADKEKKEPAKEPKEKAEGKKPEGKAKQ